ncbi:hypothetical protein H696_01643 [Fonticula alba]|uniref:F-BAR domain-containing protein n=1 Tax=Fonticula alba TaxID=691883 RepID=A0A058ZE94_FONAL|nr:hypothetical protein H696_01643 [Fonticula alba]KCV72243.1 hypothetical protein H696_01643 [Fonticula alba]|eukprot:XP_009493821.1 hypothetical protein H696_01643 [Fonticula alba]
MSWGSELWDKFRELDQVTKENSDSVSSFVDFLRKKAALDLEYSRGLQKLTKATLSMGVFCGEAVTMTPGSSGGSSSFGSFGLGQSSSSGSTNPKSRITSRIDEFRSTTSLSTALRSMLQETYEAATCIESHSITLNDEAADLSAKLLKDIEAQRKSINNEYDSKKTELQKNIKQLETYQKNYHSVAKEADRALAAFEKVEKDLKSSKSELEKATAAYRAQTEKLRNAEESYAFILEKTNQHQTRHYREEIPNIINSIQQLEIDRILRLREAILLYSDSYLLQAPKIVTAFENIALLAGSIDAASDCQIYIDAFASGGAYPPDMVFVPHRVGAPTPDSFVAFSSIGADRLGPDAAPGSGGPSGTAACSSTADLTPATKRWIDFADHPLWMDPASGIVTPEEQADILRDEVARTHLELISLEKARWALLDLLVESSKRGDPSPSVPVPNSHGTQLLSSRLEDIEEQIDSFTTELYRCQCFLAALAGTRPPDGPMSPEERRQLTLASSQHHLPAASVHGPGTSDAYLHSAAAHKTAVMGSGLRGLQGTGNRGYMTIATHSTSGQAGAMHRGATTGGGYTAGGLAGGGGPARVVVSVGLNSGHGSDGGTSFSPPPSPGNTGASSHHKHSNSGGPLRDVLTDLHTLTPAVRAYAVMSCDFVLPNSGHSLSAGSVLEIVSLLDESGAELPVELPNFDVAATFLVRTGFPESSVVHQIPASVVHCV